MPLFKRWFYKSISKKWLFLCFSRQNAWCPHRSTLSHRHRQLCKECHCWKNIPGSNLCGPEDADASYSKTFHQFPASTLQVLVNSSLWMFLRPCSLICVSSCSENEWTWHAAVSSGSCNSNASNCHISIYSLLWLFSWWRLSMETRFLVLVQWPACL